MCTPKIVSYMHCRQCLSELPADQSPQSFADYSVGFTHHGIQVFCNRHQLNIANVDLSAVDPDDVRVDMSIEGKFANEEQVV